jgi:hypothetical protein
VLTRSEIQEYYKGQEGDDNEDHKLVLEIARTVSCGDFFKPDDDSWAVLDNCDGDYLSDWSDEDNEIEQIPEKWREPRETDD